MSVEPNNADRVFGPQIACPTGSHPLGEPIRLRLDLRWCRGLRGFEQAGDGSTTRASYQVYFKASPYQDESNRVSSSLAQTSNRSHRGTVQWDEILYLECFERSILEVEVFSESRYMGEAYRPVAELLAKSEVQIPLLVGDLYALCLSASMAHVSNNHDECGYNMQIGYYPENQLGRIHVDTGIRPNVPTAHITNSLHTSMSQLILFTEAAYQSKAPSLVPICHRAYWIQKHIHNAYQDIPNQQASDHPKVVSMMSSMMLMMNAILPMASSYLKRRPQYVNESMLRLMWWASIMSRLFGEEPSGFEENPEIELARLTILIVTPDPTCGVNSTSASSNRHTISGLIAKDTLLFVLEGIVQSSDAFPPLKSAASGLLFFATSAEMASSNKKQVRDIYKRIDGLAASLKRGATNDGMISPAHQDAIETLAQDMATLNEELEHIVAERKSRFKRFFSAKRHRAELQDIVWHLDNTRSNYTTAVATLNATTNAQVLAHVQALTFVMGVQPVPMLGTRRADTFTFPSRMSRIEEV